MRRVGEPEFRRFDEVFGVASPTKFTNVVLHAGDELRYRTPGGGGYGDPREREPDLVRADVLARFVSFDRARDVYGVAFAHEVLDDSIEVDREETGRLRRRA